MELSPGRELDALVAEKVMGFVVTNPRTGPAFNVGGGVTIRYLKTWMRSDGETLNEQTLPRYSTEIAPAWLVVEKLRSRFVFEIHSNGNPWVAAFSGASSDAETAPHAICLAALKAVGQLV